ncbi:MAG: hypothetical protein H6741_29390 [Alphaproteobacteria bacterium]|nr:hypothetical protein [Alphaproteobacteria bacterium]MCB9796835.1 hypothetical protein [Alphaproteobacteria bacterium]
MGLALVTRATPLLAGMMSCATPEAEPSVYAPELTTDSATVDAEALQEALDALLMALPTLSAAEPLAGYDAALSHADAACPVVAPREAEVSWSGPCETSAGVLFYGHGAHQGAEAEGGRSVFMEGRVEATLRFDGAGSLQLERETTDAQVRSASLVDGAFSWGGARGWMAEGWALSLELHTHDEGETRRLIAQGVVALPPGRPLLAVAFDAWTLETGTCPTGGLELRTARGWATLAPEGEGCCGALEPGGERLCPDPELALSWEGAPWD